MQEANSHAICREIGCPFLLTELAQKRALAATTLI